MEDVKYIHYWKTQISDKRLQVLLDQYSLYSKKIWCILLDEKLRRIEKEIAVV